MGDQRRQPVRRRTYLATLGTVGAAMTAGCGSATDTKQGEPSRKAVPAPSVRSGDRWELKTPNSEPRLLQKGSVALFDYQAVGHIRQYEDTLLRDRIRKDTFGEVDRPFAVAFCGRIDIFPSTASIVSGIVGDIDSSMVSRLKDSMREFGVQSLREEGPEEIPNVDADFRTVVGEYHIDPVTIDGVEVPHNDRSRLEFGGGSLPIKGVVGNWKSDGSILIGGGVYPKGSFRDSEEIRMSDAISLSVDVDLDLQPHQREQDVFSFVRSISI